MTKVIATRPVEDCFDQDLMRELEIDPPMTEDVMRRLARGGKLQYFPHFPRPFFRIDRDRHYVIQGVVGNRVFRVTYAKSSQPTTPHELVRLIEKGAGDGS